MIITGGNLKAILNVKEEANLFERLCGLVFRCKITVNYSSRELRVTHSVSLNIKRRTIMSTWRSDASGELLTSVEKICYHVISLNYEVNLIKL